MSTDFYLKRNDTSPAIQIAAKDSVGNAINITDADIRFIMTDYYGTEIVDAAGEVISGVDGTMKYIWQAGDTNTAGFFKAEFEVTYSDGSIETFPNYGHLEVYIQEDLD